MGCTECADGNHLSCIRRNIEKDYPDCTCQHRLPNPASKELKMANKVTEGRFAHLTRETYTPVEIAYMMGKNVRFVRALITTKKKLKAHKEGNAFLVRREDLIEYFNELYGEV